MNRTHLAFVLVAFACVSCGGGDGGLGSFTVESGVAVADLNNDGRLDLAQVTTYVAHAPPHPGSVSVQVQDPQIPGRFLAPAAYAVGDDPWNLVVRDLNADGRADIVAANTASESVSVLHQDGSRPGTFSGQRQFSCGRSPYAVAVGHFNGDGLPDLAVARNSTVPGGVAILLQQSEPADTFAAETEIVTGGGLLSVAAGDVDADGRDDVVAAGGGFVFVVLQDSSAPGTFLAPTPLQAGLRPQAVAIADMNGDGVPDVVAANTGSTDAGRGASLSVLLQRADQPGSFAPAVNYVTADGARNLWVDDFDGDGVTDVALAHLVVQAQAPGGVSVFRGDPSSPGRLLSATTYRAGRQTQFIAAGDLNADARVDLAVNGDGASANVFGAPGIFFQDPDFPGEFLPLNFVR